MSSKILNKIIDDVMETSNLVDLANRLKMFIAYVESSPDQKKPVKKFLNELEAHLSFLSFTNDEDPYQILCADLAVNQYLSCCCYSNYLPGTITAFIKDHIDDINERVENPQGVRLSKEDINTMMAYLEERFVFCKKLFKFDKLRISLIDNSFDDVNSFYRAIIMEDDSIMHNIFIPYEMKNFCHSQIYSLLHELGHALHTAITRDVLSVPNSFRIIQEHMFQESLNDMSLQLVEIFADCFVCAVTAGTELEADNPLSIIHLDDKELLIRYFDSLIENYVTA